MAPGTLPSDGLIELIDSYSRRIYPAVLEQHDASVVCSPLGIWLLLAACAVGATGESLRALEDTIGCSAADALEALSAFMARTPPAVKAAIACWVSVAGTTEVLSAWARRLPDQVESGHMPTQAEADTWANRNTFGLIKRFPLDIDADTRIVLASAVATRVSWRAPFAVAQAGEALGAGSPWRGMVDRVLWDEHPGKLAVIAESSRAGMVAAHAAPATEDLTVVSVSADPGVARDAVLDAAHEVAALMRGDGSSARSVSLFELERGEGHSWTVDERVLATDRPGERRETIADAYMPAWHVNSSFDLLGNATFGCEPALSTLRELIGPGPTDFAQAAQSAIASFTRYGFKAAAVTAMGVLASARMPPSYTGLERTATLRFDHPYAAIALVGQLDEPQDKSEFFALPVFTAWVAAPHEADADR